MILSIKSISLDFKIIAFGKYKVNPPKSKSDGFPAISESLSHRLDPQHVPHDLFFYYLSSVLTQSLTGRHALKIGS